MSRSTHHAFELLRRADPLAAVDAADLWRDAQALRPRAAALSDVGGVVAAAPAGRGLSRKRVAVVVLAVVAAFVIAVPALGIDVPVLDFGEAEKAPPRVVREFASLAVGAPPGMDPAVVAGQTRKVKTVRFQGREHVLWVAPTEAGGQCFMWSELAGGCDRLGTVPLSVTWAGSMETPTYVLGHANAEHVRTVQLRFEGGTTVDVPLTWVSEPIAAGFFLYDLRADERVEGLRLQSVDALDDEGRLVARQASASDAIDEVPPEAVADDRDAVSRSRNEGGEAVLWQAPTRYDGLCTWLEYQGRTRSLGCRPQGYGGEGTAAGFLSTPTDVVLHIDVSLRTSRVELNFADGSRRVIRETGGFALFAVPRANLADDRRLIGATMLRANGDVVVQFPFDKSSMCLPAAECPFE